MAPRTKTLLHGLAFLYLVDACLAWDPQSSVQFKTWFQGFRLQIEYILHDNCTTELKSYYDPTYHPWQPTSCHQCRPQPLVDCILANLDEMNKANGASAAVLLGILPSTLALIGLNYLETGLLALRRPFLAFLLASGSPAVSPMRTIDYRDPSDILQKRKGSYRAPHLGRRSGALVLAAEYLLVIAAVANVAVVTWQLCLRTTCNFATDTVFMPTLWPSIGVVIHIVATASVALKVRFVDPQPASNRRGIIAALIKRELSPGSRYDGTVLRPSKESMAFLFMSWLVSTGTILHIIVGTLVFSSMLFISTEDACYVMGQYLGSTLVCQMVLMYEMAGLRETVHVEELPKD